MASLPRLQSLIFELTRQCNHACLHCYNIWHASPYPAGQLKPSRTLDLLAKALDETICSHVTLTGGEPLLRPDLPQILDFLRSRRVRVTLITNGHLLTGSQVADLVRLGVDLFELPLLSHLPSMHDELSASPGAWQAVLSAMADIRLAHSRVVVSFVATRRNISHLHETMRLASAFGAHGLMLNRFNPGGRGISRLDELLPSLEQVAQALAVADSASQEFHLPVSCSIPIQPCLLDLQKFPHLSFGFCAACTDRAYYTLDSLGNLRPCNHSSTILGNLFEHSFAELISSPSMQDFKSAVPVFCAPCARVAECQGGCKASAQVCYGSLSVAEPFLRKNQGNAARTNPVTTSPIPASLGG